MEFGDVDAGAAEGLALQSFQKAASDHKPVALQQIITCTGQEFFMLRHNSEEPYGMWACHRDARASNAALHVTALLKAAP
jgi:hypothetical protein